MSDQTAEPQDGRSYTIRRYESGDGDGLRSLREEIWEQRLSEEWFRWKYIDNPYVDHVPMFVAESDGEVVGTRPFMAFRMRVGESTPLALLATDTMVSPDHRHQGLFTRMTEATIRHYTDSEPAFVFNFPNSKSRPGYRKLGWRVLEPSTTRYRVQNPVPLVDSRTDRTSVRLLARAATPLNRGLLGIGDRLGASADDTSVERVRGVPSRVLASLYERHVPDGVHALRDEEFYDWRYASPRWDSVNSYVATRSGEPVAGVVVQTRTTGDGVRVTTLADIVPMEGDADWKRSVQHLLCHVGSHHRRSDVLVAPDGVVPAGTMTAHGFLSNRSVPLSMVSATPLRLCVRSLTDGPDRWRISGRSLTDPSTWRLSLSERPYY